MKRGAIPELPYNGLIISNFNCLRKFSKKLAVDKAS